MHINRHPQDYINSKRNDEHQTTAAREVIKCYERYLIDYKRWYFMILPNISWEKNKLWSNSATSRCGLLLYHQSEARKPRAKVTGSDHAIPIWKRVSFYNTDTSSDKNRREKQDFLFLETWKMLRWTYFGGREASWRSFIAAATMRIHHISQLCDLAKPKKNIVLARFENHFLLRTERVHLGSAK